MNLLAAKIYTLLSTDIDVVALAGDRTQPAKGKQSPIYPQVVWQLIVSEAQTTHDGDEETDGGLDRTDLQFSCWADTEFDANALRKAVRTALMRRGAMEGVKVNSPVERTFLEQEVEKHNAQLDLTFWHNPNT